MGGGGVPHGGRRMGWLMGWGQGWGLGGHVDGRMGGCMDGCMGGRTDGRGRGVGCVEDGKDGSIGVGCCMGCIGGCMGRGRPCRRVGRAHSCGCIARSVAAVSSCMRVGGGGGRLGGCGDNRRLQHSLRTGGWGSSSEC